MDVWSLDKVDCTIDPGAGNPERMYVVSEATGRVGGGNGGATNVKIAHVDLANKNAAQFQLTQNGRND